MAKEDKDSKREEAEKAQDNVERKRAEVDKRQQAQLSAKLAAAADDEERRRIEEEAQMEQGELKRKRAEEDHARRKAGEEDAEKASVLATSLEATRRKAEEEVAKTKKDADRATQEERQLMKVLVAHQASFHVCLPQAIGRSKIVVEWASDKSTVIAIYLCERNISKLPNKITHTICW